MALQASALTDVDFCHDSAKLIQASLAFAAQKVVLLRYSYLLLIADYKVQRQIANKQITW